MVQHHCQHLTNPTTSKFYLKIQKPKFWSLERMQQSTPSPCVLRASTETFHCPNSKYEQYDLMIPINQETRKIEYRGNVKRVRTNCDTSHTGILRASFITTQNEQAFSRFNFPDSCSLVSTSTSQILSILGKVQRVNILNVTRQVSLDPHFLDIPQLQSFLFI